MKMLRALLIAFIVGQLAQTAKGEEVIILSSIKDLEAAVAKSRFLLVFGYGMFCGECKPIHAEWEAAAKELKKHNIMFAKLDANNKNNIDLIKKLGAESPVKATLKVFRQGDTDKFIDYTGPRVAKGIVTFFTKRMSPRSTLLKSKKDVEKLIANSPDDVVVLAHVPSEQSPAYQAFFEAAGTYVEGITYGHVLDRKYLEKCSRDCSSPILIMHKRHEDEKPRYEGSFTVEQLKKWIDSHATPLVGIFDEEDQSLIRGFSRSYEMKSLPHVYIVVPTRAEIDETLIRTIGEAAKANDDLKFMLVGLDKGERILTTLKIPTHMELPMFYIHFSEDSSKKYMKEGMKIENLPEFLEEFKVGALKPYLKSQDPQAVKASGAFDAVVTENYEEKVLKSEKPVFLLVQETKCDDCSKGTAILSKAAGGFKDFLYMAKFDKTANDIADDRIKTEGEYAVYWFPKGSEEPEKVNIEFAEPDLPKFLIEKLQGLGVELPEEVLQLAEEPKKEEEAEEEDVVVEKKDEL